MCRVGYSKLLSNRSEYRPNNSTNIQRYLYSRKLVCRTGRCAHAELSHFPFSIAKFIDYSSCWMINLASYYMFWCAVSLYIFYSLLMFWLALRACQNTAQLVRAILHTTTCNKMYVHHSKALQS